VGKVDIPSVAACLKRCALYIGNDSGLMHMAAASNIPTLGLFGPSKCELYAPTGAHTAFIRTPESFDELISVPGYDHRTTGTMMGNLKVEDVIDATTKLWLNCQNQKTKQDII
jgi:ADP-heptose:LPS heptosyltransferase